MPRVSGHTGTWAVICSCSYKLQAEKLVKNIFLFYFLWWFVRVILRRQREQGDAGSSKTRAQCRGTWPVVRTGGFPNNSMPGLLHDLLSPGDLAFFFLGGMTAVCDTSFLYRWPRVTTVCTYHFGCNPAWSTSAILNGCAGIAYWSQATVQKKMYGL